MSELRIAVPDAILKSFIDDIPEALRPDMPAWVLALDPTTQPIEEAPKPPVKPRRRREERKSGLWAVVHAAREHGFTPPSEGFWVMLPKEYDAILALEPKPVAQVVLEVLRQTIGTVVQLPDGRTTRKEWARISQRHFARAGIMSNKDAWHGIEGALKEGYVLRREAGGAALNMPSGGEGLIDPMENSGGGYLW